MNIFYLDSNPEVAAAMLCDQHLNKMLLESAQMLCTISDVADLYKPTHINHPCVKWLQESEHNVAWLTYHMVSLETQRSLTAGDKGKLHKSLAIGLKATSHLRYGDWTKATQPPQCMPLLHQRLAPEFAVAAYQDYYVAKDKQWRKTIKPGPMRWTGKRRIPDFMLDALINFK